jgi:hypothetical protein
MTAVSLTPVAGSDGLDEAGDGHMPVSFRHALAHVDRDLVCGRDEPDVAASKL